MSLCSKTIDHANILQKVDWRKDRQSLCSQDVQRQKRSIKNNLPAVDTFCSRLVTKVTFTVSY